MINAHNGNAAGDVFTEPFIITEDGHPLLCQYKEKTGEQGLNRCYYDFPDATSDGILDFDFDFDGDVDARDTQILQMIGSGDMTLDGKITALDNLLYQSFMLVGTHEYWLQLCIRFNIFGT